MKESTSTDQCADMLKALADAAVEIGAYQGSALATRRAWASTHEGELTALIRVMAAASDYIAANKAEAAQAYFESTFQRRETPDEMQEHTLAAETEALHHVLGMHARDVLPRDGDRRCVLGAAHDAFVAEPGPHHFVEDRARFAEANFK